MSPFLEHDGVLIDRADLAASDRMIDVIRESSRRSADHAVEGLGRIDSNAPEVAARFKAIYTDHLGKLLYWDAVRSAKDTGL